MKNQRTWSSFVPSFLALSLAASIACSSTSESNRDYDRDTEENEPTDSGTSKPDARAEAGKAGEVGTYSDRGVRMIAADLSSGDSWTCQSVCADNDGTCTVGGNGAGYATSRYNDGSGTLSFQVSTCTEVKSLESGNTTLTGLSCYCDDVPVPPTVRVEKSEGLHSCNDVCKSWSRACDDEREGRVYTNADGTEWGSSQCADVPNGSTYHYVCPCTDDADGGR